MTAQPQTGYPEQHDGWQQTPAWSDAEGPSGLTHAFAGFSRAGWSGPEVPAQASGSADSYFAGHDGDGPSGLSFTPVPQPTVPDPAAQQGYSGSGHLTAAPQAHSASGHPASAQQAYAGPGYAASPQQAYAESGYSASAQEGFAGPGYAASPQQAYAESGYPASPPQAYAESGYAVAAQRAYAAPAYSDGVYGAASAAGYPGAPVPPQAAYPTPPTVADQAAYAVPGYLQPYGRPAGGSGKGPGVGAVVAATLFLGPFGAIWAARRSDRARAVGDSTGKYWLAFGGTLVGGWVVGAVSLILVLAMSGLVTGAAAGSGSTANTAVALQQSIVQQGTFPDAAGKKLQVKAATCQAYQLSGDANGTGLYKCTLGLTNGTKDAVIVSLDSAGRWKVTGQAK